MIRQTGIETRLGWSADEFRIYKTNIIALIVIIIIIIILVIVVYTIEDY